MRVSLARLDKASGRRTVIAEFITNNDGRTGKALAGKAFAPGFYEWIFYAGKTAFMTRMFLFVKSVGAAQFSSLLALS